MGNPVFTVYRVTNLKNQKIYVGVHKTRVPDDEYLGSGTLIVRAVAKYGPASFSKEVLHIFSRKEEAYAKEAAIVDAPFVARDDTYNLVLGGVIGGWYDNHKGNKNSQFASAWVCRPGEKRKISSGSLPEYLAAGWLRGSSWEASLRQDARRESTPERARLLREQRRSRIPLLFGGCRRAPPGPANPTSTRVFVHRGGEVERIPEALLAQRLGEGWARGRSSGSGWARSRASKDGDAMKLTWKVVDEIRARYSSGGVSQASLGAEFGVSQVNISNIVRGKTWVKG